MKLRLLSLFSGIGAFEKALTNIDVDYELVGFSEIDKYAIKSYCAIHGVDESLNLGDITKINIEKLSTNIDIITHGSPCQDFSIAGQQQGADKGSETRSSLMWNTVEIVRHCKPKYVIWENVKNVLSKKHKHNFDKYIDELNKLGYISYYKVLNAKDYGVPQNRERIFVVSILGEHKPYEFPIGFELTKCIKDILEDNVEEKYYINKPFKLVEGSRIKAEFTNINFDQTKRIHGTDSYFQTLGAVDRGTNNILVEGYLTDFSYKQISRILNDEGICPTLDTMQGGYREPKIFHLKDGDKIYKVRKLTPLECWRLMGFDDESFYKAKNVGISNSQLYKQAGNSIVVNVLEAIFKNLLK